MWNASPAGGARRTNQVLFRSPLRREVKLRREPSGDHLGADESRVGSVKRKGVPSGAPPFKRWTQTSRWRRLSFSTTVVRVKATYSPGGESATSLTNDIR